METLLCCDQIYIQLKNGIDIKNITNELSQCIAKSNISNGFINVIVVGSTGSITTIEYEPGVVKDLKEAINRIAPHNIVYEHEKAWHDGNGHSHVQAAIIGPSITLPVRQGKMLLGTWQQVVVINHDNKDRNRQIEITITGTTD